MKRFIAIVTSIMMLLSLFALGINADETKTIDYGTAKLDLRVIDAFAGETAFVDGYGSLGSGTFKDGTFFIESSHNMYDAYSIKTKAIETADWDGMQYVVFEVENTSDGDIYFGFQPAAADGSSLFMSSALAEIHPVVMYNTNKNEVKNAKWSGVQAINNRDCFIVPWKFTGYIFMPMYIMADLNKLGTSLMPDGGSFSAYGFHAYLDDATYIEITIKGMYACAELPVFEAPEKPTEAPTEKPTEAPTAAPTEAPTAAPTEAMTEVPTAAPTEAATAAPETKTQTEAVTDKAEKSGCGSILGNSAVLILLSASAFAFTKKKHA